MFQKTTVCKRSKQSARSLVTVLCSTFRVKSLISQELTGLLVCTESTMSLRNTATLGAGDGGAAAVSVTSSL